MKKNEILKEIKTVNSIDELAEYLNDWQEANPEDDSDELIAAYADENPECHIIDDSEWDYLTDGETVLSVLENGAFGTYSLSYSYTAADAVIASRIKTVGCVFTSNSDPAHTDDYPSELAAILYKIDKAEVLTLSPADNDYREAADKLGLSGDYSDYIYKVDDVLFAVA